MDTNAPPPLRLISLEETERRVDKRKSFIYQAIRDGRFPRPVKIGSSTSFVESEVEDWIRDQIAARDGLQARPAKRRHAPVAA